MKGEAMVLRAPRWRPSVGETDDGEHVRSHRRRDQECHQAFSVGTK